MRIVVVLPANYIEARVNCLEYAADAVAKGHIVFLVDYSQLGSNYQPTRLRDRFISAYKTNKLSKVIKDYSVAFGINLVVPKAIPVTKMILPVDPSKEMAFKSLVSSSLSYITGHRDTILEELPPKISKIMQRTFMKVDSELTALIIDKKIDYVVTANGRFLIDGCAVLIARTLGIGYSLLERAGAEIGRFQDYPLSPHYIGGRIKLQDDLWNSELRNKILLADKGLTRKMSAPLDGGLSWKNDFNVNYAISDFAVRKIAVFFPTTELEFLNDRYWQDLETFNGDQKAAFLAFSRIAKEEGYHVIVRVHPPGPYSELITSREDLLWSNLCAEVGAEVLMSRSGVDSYSLIRDSDLSVTYVSSIGIEAICLGAPTLLLGESDYSQYVPANCAFDEPEIRRKLQEGVPIASREQLYPWGLFYEAGGVPYKVFQVDSDHNILLDGVKLEQVPGIMKNRIVLKVWKAVKCLRNIGS